MALFSEKEIDALSDGLKRAAIAAVRLPESEIAAWFINYSDGPQFWLGTPPRPGMQPLFYQPVTDEQIPVAWRDCGSRLITQDRSMYRDDLEWKPLYLAR